MRSRKCERYEGKERERAGEVQSRDDDALSSPSQQGNACMHSVATGKRYLPSMRGTAAGTGLLVLAGGWLR